MNMQLERLAAVVELEARTWALKLEVLHALLQARDRLAYPAEDLPKLEAARRGPVRAAGGVAVIPLKGVLMPQVSMLAALFGMGSGLGEFRSSLRDAASNPDVGSIVLDIDSPGGLVDLIPEVAKEVRQVNESKPITAVSNTLAASAAYWIAAQASEIVVTPSGEMGSIGVFSEHVDVSGAEEKAGLKTTLISAGKYKVDGNPFEPLSGSAEEALQQGVDDFYNLFTKDVAIGRGVKQSEVKSGYGEGRSLTAQRAVDANLADRIGTIDEVVAGLAGRGTSSGAVRSHEASEAGYTPEDLERVFESIEAVAEAARKEAVT